MPPCLTHTVCYFVVHAGLRTMKKGDAKLLRSIFVEFSQASAGDIKAVEWDRRHEAKQQSLKLRESAFYTHMRGFAEVSELISTVLRVYMYGPILRHSHARARAWS